MKDEAIPLPEDLVSDTGVTLPVGDFPSPEMLRRRIAEASGLAVRWIGEEYESGASDESCKRSSEAGSAASAPVATAGAEAAAPRPGASSEWMQSLADELVPDGGVWTGPLDDLLGVWTGERGWSWRYDGDAGAIEIVRSESRTFGVNALVGEQDYQVSVTTEGEAGEETSGGTKQSLDATMKYEPWKEIAEHVCEVARGGADVLVSEAAGTVSVRGAPAAVASVREYLQRLDRHTLRPVSLSMHIYSVQFDRSRDFEVGLSGVLPDILGSSVDLVLSGAGVTVVKPSFANANSLRATVDAMARVGKVWRVKTFDLASLAGRPSQAYDLVDRAYLKEIRTTLGEGRESVALTPGMVSSGFGVSFVARIVGPDTVLARITATIQDPHEFSQFGSGGNAIQLPTGGRRASVSTLKIAEGETLVVTGYSDRSTTESESGTFLSWLPLPEGGRKSGVDRTELVMLVTADVGEPLGISEWAVDGRRPGAGA
ncbi:MAG: hypothetical protein OXH14_05975 [Alphaproteobacteria bacterium]|nr:hypothetical protein [Alphaproteobacteria bacterium]